MSGIASNGPACPEEYVWIHPGMLVDYRDRQMLLVMDYPDFLCNQWVVKCQYTSDTYGHMACSDLSPYRDGLSAELTQAHAELAAERQRVAELAAEVERLERGAETALEFIYKEQRVTTMVAIQRDEARAHLATIRERLAALAPLAAELEQAWIPDEETREHLSPKLEALLAGIAELQALVGEQTKEAQEEVKDA